MRRGGRVQTDVALKTNAQTKFVGQGFVTGEGWQFLKCFSRQSSALVRTFFQDKKMYSAGSQGNMTA